ncbi:fimbrial protein [Vibrio caribbeanicus]|uniref:fimbrial protein n=1 Tax=Vibrio caribbeanicus TaxID=701175 RepID=UPI0022850101|nr:adhesin [Vibrio caribbeanicus]MCY9843215.1 adhesin [Vibrio caribbeanicus]
MTPRVMALACYSATEAGNMTNFYIDPSASVPMDAPNGQIVWRGPSQKVTITCYKDVRNYPNYRYLREHVYFWPGKTGNTVVPHIPGIKVGFRYQGTDIYGEKVAINNFIVSECYSYESDQACEKRTRTTRTITYQPIIVTDAGEFRGYSSPVNIFQVDGEIGYNGKFANYRSVIANMDILKPSKCLVELEIKNNNVDYGRIGVNDIAQMEPSPLTIIVRNVKYGPDCPSVKLRGYFDNVRDLTNKSYIPVFDQNNQEIQSFGIKLYTPDGKEVTLNEPVGNGYEITQIGYDRYLAKLVPLGVSNINKGKFQGMVVYTVSYL